MKNSIPTTLNPLEVAASRAIQGAGEVGAVINLSAHYLTGLSPLVDDLYGRPGDEDAEPPVEPIEGKQPLYLEAKVAHTVARALRREALDQGRQFVAKSVNTLKGQLGTRWNSSWQALGFTNGSLILPRNPLPVLTLLGAYFRTHTELEVEDLDLTSDRAEELKAAIVAAQTAADAARDAERAAKASRDEAKGKLRRRLGGLREELRALLRDDDTRWYRFGFRRPVDGETPDLIQSLTVRVGGVGEVIAEWSRPRLAESYRVSWRFTVDSVDGETTQVGFFSDQQAVITGLPTGEMITVIVTARNAAGESAPTEAEIMIP